MSLDDAPACFDLFDKESSGSIGGDVISTAIRSLGYCVSNEELTEMGASGSMDLAKFQDIAAKCTIPSVDEVLEAFSVFDQNGNGYIALSELQHLMKTLGEGLSEEELAAMSAQAEPDDEGQINIRHIVTKLLAN